MAYWNEHAFASHTDTRLDGYFVSPVTNDTCTLSWAQRHIGQSILRRWFANDEKPWGEPMGYSISRAMAEEWAGLVISDNLWKSAIDNLERAGVFSVIREQGEAHKFQLGKLIRCDLKECQVELHYPPKYPLPNVSTPLAKDRGDLATSEETPNFSPDTKNLNNSLITLNTLSEVQEVLEVPGSLPGATANPVEPKGKPANEELQEWLDSLPEHWVKWSWISAGLKGYDKPTKRDLAYAEQVYKETGLDLEPNGTWQDGRANPRPAQALKQYN
jgi:hypothetical protein